MNRRRGHVDVVTEVGYCNFCSRIRNLRREEHHLGTLVRTIVTCETCHRTLSSSMGVAQPEPAAEPVPEPAAAPVAEPPDERKSATASKKTVAPTAGSKPRSTTTRKATRSK